MRKRIEISYLTFLGLSLTVVITACKDHSSEAPYFSVSNVSDNQMGIWNSNDLVDILKANNKERSTFVYDDNCFSHKALHQTTQLLVDVRQSLTSLSTLPQISLEFNPDRLAGYSSIDKYRAELSLLTYTHLLDDFSLLFTDLFATYLVRAGPLT